MSTPTSADFRARLEAIESKTFAARAPVRDPAPGYYVSAENDVGDKRIVEGPFDTHAEALCAVRGVRLAWEEVDPRACWYGWGTARVHATTPAAITDGAS